MTWEENNVKLEHFCVQSKESERFSKGPVNSLRLLTKSEELTKI